jgi:predicted nucleic acid-binding protein
MSILVDSNVILDILTVDKVWYEWSSNKLMEYSENNKLIINQIIYAEISMKFSKIEELDEVVAEANIKCENLPWEAGFLAGKCFIQYKKRGGSKNSVLPDFYIGAHAAITKRAILTRYQGRYGTYFSNLSIISPQL